MAINGLRSLLAKLDKLGGNSSDALAQGVGEAAKRVQGAAKMNAPVDTGQLRNSLQTDVQRNRDGARGRIYTNVEYAPYVEFGTGPKGRDSDKSALPADIRAKLNYRNDGWWVHESQVDAKVFERMGNKADTERGRFAYSLGQPAQPFLYPALAANKDKAVSDVERVLRQYIRGLER
jgi:HK97 gp10 family phage protein